MIGKIISLPFWLVSRLTGVAFGILKLAGSFVFGVVGLVMDHVIGSVVGALAGLLLGKDHVGVKLFTHKKRRHA